jgi:cytosine deaminase
MQTLTPASIEMITVNPAAAVGVPDYGLRVGGPADLVVFDAPLPRHLLAP